jgi:hypothetical protein
MTWYGRAASGGPLGCIGPGAAATAPGPLMRTARGPGGARMSADLSTGRARTGQDRMGRTSTTDVRTAWSDGIQRDALGRPGTALTWFRSRWGNPWGFESPRSHPLLTRRFAVQAGEHVAVGGHGDGDAGVRERPGAGTVEDHRVRLGISFESATGDKCEDPPLHMPRALGTHADVDVVVVVVRVGHSGGNAQVVTLALLPSRAVLRTARPRPRVTTAHGFGPDCAFS